MKYTELFDSIDELLESGDLIVSNGRLYSAVDDLLDEEALNEFFPGKGVRAQSNIVNAQTNTDETKAEKLNKKAEKARDYIDKLARSKFKGRRDKAKTMAKNIKDRLDNANTVNNSIAGLNQTKTEYIKNRSESKTAVHGVEPKPKTEETNESVLVFNMPDTVMLTESDNYEFFLEQVLAYNGFKVTENNVNVLHAALENGHAVIE